VLLKQPARVLVAGNGGLTVEFAPAVWQIAQVPTLAESVVVCFSPAAAAENQGLAG
jgi:hypothetical protein